MIEVASLEFRAMACRCRIVVDRGHEGLLPEAAELVSALEARWSRFLPTSEVSALNRRAGHLTVLSPSTYELIDKADRAMAATGGLFNPLMLDQLEALGYERSWDEGSTRRGTDEPVGPAVDEAIELVPEITAVRLPEGVRFDPGGIGKGLAADQAVSYLGDRGATTVSVELGGDLRVAGRPWYGDRWRIGVADPFRPDDEVAAFTPAAGAVTTSTTTRRAWTVDGERRHHLLDPATGRPAAGGNAAVTVCSEAAWWAEVVAKSALIAGSRGEAVLRAQRSPGVIVTDDGRVLSVNPNQDGAGHRRAVGVGA